MSARLAGRSQQIPDLALLLTTSRPPVDGAATSGAWALIEREDIDMAKSLRGGVVPGVPRPTRLAHRRARLPGGLAISDARAPAGVLLASRPGDGSSGGKYAASSASGPRAGPASTVRRPPRATTPRDPGLARGSAPEGHDRAPRRRRRGSLGVAGPVRGRARGTEEELVFIKDALQHTVLFHQLDPRGARRGARAMTRAGGAGPEAHRRERPRLRALPRPGGHLRRHVRAQRRRRQGERQNPRRHLRRDRAHVRVPAKRVRRRRLGGMRRVGP